MIVTRQGPCWGRALLSSAMMVSSAATLARWNVRVHSRQTDEPQRRSGRQACKLARSLAVGIGELAVGSLARPLPCTGQDLDHRGVPFHRPFHGERLAQERRAFTEPSLVADHIWQDQMSCWLHASFVLQMVEKEAVLGLKAGTARAIKTEVRLEDPETSFVCGAFAGRPLRASRGRACNPAPRHPRS